MEDNGIIKRVVAKDDKRRNYIEITERTLAGKKSIEEKLEKIELIAREGIPEKDIEKFYSVLDKMIDNLRK